MKKILFLPAFLWATCCFSQRQHVYFLKNNGKYVLQRDSANYIRIVNEPDSASVLYNVTEFYLNGKKKLVGKSKTGDPPRYEGQCTRYYANGAQESITNYKNNSKSGLQYDFYRNGKPYLVTEYIDDAASGGYFKEYQIKANYDSLGTVLVENGNGYAKIYDADFKIVAEEGNVKEGKREGTWKGNNKNPALSFSEDYQNGQLISGTATSVDGTITTYTKSRNTLPKFPGGIEAFSRYLSSNTKYPRTARKYGIQGQVVLSFVVEKDGKTTDITITKSVDPAIDQEAVRVISDSPLWIPGVQFGRPVRVVYSIPINFYLKE